MAGRRIALGLLAGAVALAAAAVGTAAQDARLVLCSAREDGVHRWAAERIGQSVREPGPAIRAVETKGSLDNLRRMAKGDCDAAIVQLDALMVYSMERVSRRLKITVPVRLYDEWLHLVCRRASGIDDVGDLLRNAERRTILTGTPGSGSETTWRALTDLDRDYRRVGTRSLGGQEALDALLAGGPGDCMAVVVGANAPFLVEVDKHGDALRLVSVDLLYFRDSELVDNRVYKSVRIPAGTYERLQAGPDNSATETIAVGAMLVVAKRWARAHPKAYDSFMGAVSDALPAIRERVKG